MVPKLRVQKRVKELEFIQHVIEYIRDLELILSEDESYTPSSTQMGPIVSILQLFYAYLFCVWWFIMSSLFLESPFGLNV